MIISARLVQSVRLVHQWHFVHFTFYIVEVNVLFTVFAASNVIDYLDRLLPLSLADRIVRNDRTCF